MQYGYAKTNPRTVVKSIATEKNKPEANRPWTFEELAIVEKLAPPQLLLPIMIARFTGLRKGDILKLCKTNLVDGKLIVGTSKTGKKVKWELNQKLLKLIKLYSPENSLMICTNTQGDKWAINSFNSAFFKFKKKLEAKKLLGSGITFHGLRTTLAQELKINGFSDEQIAVALAHSNSRVTKLYTRQVDDQQTMSKIVSFFNNEKSG